MDPVAYDDSAYSAHLTWNPDPCNQGGGTDCPHCPKPPPALRCDHNLHDPAPWTNGHPCNRLGDHTIHNDGHGTTWTPP